MANNKGKKGETTAAGQKGSTTHRELTPKQRVYIQAYTNIENPETFGNGTKSAQKAYNSEYNVAAAQSSALLKHPRVKDEVNRILDEIGFDSQVRLSALKQIALGKIKSKTITKGQTFDSDGNAHKYTTTTEQEPSATARIHAINTVEKIAGTYDKNRARAEVMSGELKALIQKQKKNYTRTVNAGGPEKENE